MFSIYSPPTDSYRLIRRRQLGPTITDQVGMIIIRAWIEEGSSEPLRAHIRITDDVSAGVERTLTLTQPDAVSLVVQEWLAEMVRGKQPD